MSNSPKQIEWRKNNKQRLAQYAKEWRASEKGKRSELNRHLLRKYHITLEDKQRMWDDQCGLCAVCHKPLPDIFARDCQVEHDHETNEVRSLAHWYCNIMVGVAENHPTLLEDVFAYLKRCDSPNSREPNFERSAEMPDPLLHETP